MRRRIFRLRDLISGGAGAGLLALILGGIGSFDPPTPIEPPGTPPTEHAAALDAHNTARERHGLRNYAASSALDREAQAWADAIARSGRPTHTGWQTRIRAAGFSSGSENLAWGSAPLDGRDATNLWLTSPGHRANVLGPYTHAGFGSSQQGATVYWVGLYGGGREALSEPPPAIEK